MPSAPLKEVSVSLFAEVDGGIAQIALSAQRLTTQMLGDAHYELMIECLNFLRAEGLTVETPERNDHSQIMRSLYAAEELAKFIPQSDCVSAAAAAGDVLIALGGLHHRMHYLINGGLREPNEIARLLAAAELLGVTQAFLALAKVGVLPRAAVLDVKRAVSTDAGRLSGERRRAKSAAWQQKALRAYEADTSKTKGLSSPAAWAARHQGDYDVKAGTIAKAIQRLRKEKRHRSS